MLNKDALKLVEDRVKQILTPLGFDLIELKSMNSPQGMMLRFLIDRVESGIRIKECAELNRRISQLIDETGIVTEEYVLEVSSPGLDRILVNYEDFARILNKRIHISLREKQDNKLDLEGELVKLNSEGLSIIRNSEELFVPFSKINKARQVIL